MKITLNSAVTLPPKNREVFVLYRAIIDKKLTIMRSVYKDSGWENLRKEEQENIIGWFEIGDLLKLTDDYYNHICTN